MVRSQVLTSITALSLIACLVLGGLSLYLYAKLEDTSKNLGDLQRLLSKYTVRANLLLNYGNGTRQWHNNTLIPVGANLLNLTTEAVSDSKYSTSTFGTFVVSISGVGETFTKKDHYWMWWRWGLEKSDWELGQTSADACVVRDSDIYAWFYEDTSQWPVLEKP